PNGLIPGWLSLATFRVFVGLGNAGIYAIDLPLVQEFIPGYKRGWVSALVTTMLPAGGMLAGLISWLLLPVIGWRWLFLVGLVPLVLVFMIRYWVPESPRWLIRTGRLEEARRSLAWALMIDPKEITLPARGGGGEKTPLVGVFNVPRVVSGGLLGGLAEGWWRFAGLGGSPLVCVVMEDLPGGGRLSDDLDRGARGPGAFFHSGPDRAT